MIALSVVISFEVVIDPQNVKNLANAITQEALSTDKMKSGKRIHIVSDRIGYGSVNSIPWDLL